MKAEDAVADAGSAAPFDPSLYPGTYPMLTGWRQRLIAANDTPAHISKVPSKPPRLNELRAALAQLTL